jgi:hypothetical protein
MRLVLAAVAALLLTTVAFAQKIAINSIRIEPPNPDSFTPVTIVVLGTWPTGCAPAGPTAIVAGNLIRVTATLPFSVCPAIARSTSPPPIRRSRSRRTPFPPVRRRW